MQRLDKRNLAVFGFVTAAGAITVISVEALVYVSPQESLWRDTTALAQAQVISGVLGALVAVVALAYAWKVATRQFDVLDEQGKIVDKQVELMGEQRDISSRIEALEAKQSELLQQQAGILERQGEIIKSQAAITTTQHETWLKIQERFVMLEIAAIVRNDDDKQAHVQLVVRNTGTKTAREIDWAILIPNQSLGGIAFSQMEGKKDGNLTELGTNEKAVAWKGEIHKPVFQKRQRSIATFDIAKQHANDFRIFWNINNDDGEFPPLEGADPSGIVLGELRVKIGRDGWPTTVTQVPSDSSPQS